MWTIENRPRYDRDKLRYPSDLTDPEWEQIKPLIPPAKRGVMALHPEGSAATQHSERLFLSVGL